MSIIRCHDCERQVDTDFVTCEVIEHKYGDIEVCPSCAERRMEERERADSAEAHREQVK